MTKKKTQLTKFINNALYKSNPVHSFTPIDHRVRISLKITNDEYVIAHLIDKLSKQEKEFNYDRIYNHVGMEKPDVDIVCDNLHKKGIIKFDKEKDRIVVTAVWIDALKAQEDENFQKFFVQSYGRSWPGSVSMAREAYTNAVAKVGHEYLLERKLAYFKFLSMPENSWRQTMQAHEFLNIRSERYAEPWEDYSNNLITARNNPKSSEETIVPSTLTEEKRRQMFQ